MANYTITWDETAPLGTGSKSLGDNYLRDKQTATRERLATEHTDVTGSSGDALLMHEWVVTALSAGSPYTVLSSQHVLLVTTGASDYTLNLPTAIGITGKPYKIKKVDAGAGTVIIDPNGAQTIDGGATFVLSHRYDFVTIESDGANWVITGTNTNLDWDNAWSDAVHTHLSDAEGGVLAYSGHVVQVVNTQTGAVATGTTQIPLDDTIPQKTEGTELITLAITPKAVTNYLLIEVSLVLASSANYACSVALFQDDTASALAAISHYLTATDYPYTITLKHYMLAGTTSATTFKVRAGLNGSGTITINGASGSRLFGGICASSITIKEIGV